MSVFEMNTINNIPDNPATAKTNKGDADVVKVFTALTDGADLSGFKSGVVDASVNFMKETADAAVGGDQRAVSELNTIQMYSLAEKMKKELKLFDFMGSFKEIDYRTQPMIKSSKWEGVRSRFQAASGDVPFGVYNFTEYPIGTQTISSGFAVDYREMKSGNFDGTVAEGMRLVKRDMMNKAVLYVMIEFYNAIKNAKGVKHFAESAGITKTAVDDMIGVMRPYGPMNIFGDFAVISQMNGFAGWVDVEGTKLAAGLDQAAAEIRECGHLARYNGARVAELPNEYDFSTLNEEGNNFEFVLPTGAMYFVPTGANSPLKIFKRGGLTSMSGDDVSTHMHVTRFDMEIGAGVVRGEEHKIGILGDTNLTLPK